MKRALRFAGGLVAAIVLHLIGVRLIDAWPLVVDLMLIVVVFNALDGSPVAGMFGGLVAGWATDALIGPSYGIFGLVDTIIGYGTALVVQRIVIHRAAGAALFFAAAAAAQQGLVVASSYLFLSAPEAPDLHWLLYKTVASGLLGGIVFMVRQNMLSRVTLWRQTRRTRIRLD